MKCLVVGSTGMLGSAMIKVLSRSSGLEVYGTARKISDSTPGKYNIFYGVDAENFDSIVELIAKLKPEVIINCIGLIKQFDESEDPLRALPINSLFPHRLARLAEICNARLVHISTDCVFSGDRGRYLESDYPDAKDVYGISKRLGEVVYSNCITLRTSIIGRETNSTKSLLCWFLSQTNSVKGFKNAIFSGLPTDELSRVVRDYVIPRPNLSGLYHVSSSPISKYDLLCKIATAYNKKIEIIEDYEYKIDRSLVSENFTAETGYVAPEWEILIKNMYDFEQEYTDVQK